MKMSDEDRDLMIANRPSACLSQNEEPPPGPLSFAPIGYVTHEHVLDAVGQHLFATMPDADTVSMSDAETARAVRKCLHHLRQLLFARRLDAFYVSRVEEPPMQAIEQSFWGRDAADLALLKGEYDTGFEGISAIFFKQGAIETALDGSDDAAKKPESSGGRPSIQPAVRAAYWQIYPQGHGVSGDIWKVVAAKVEKHIGQSVSEDTVKRSLKGG